MITNDTELMAAPVFEAGAEKTRPNLKVQDGCDYNCSFCTIPLARGKSRSLPVDTVVGQARDLVEEGYREIVLTGVNVGDYGRKIGGRLLDPALDAHALVRRVSDEFGSYLAPNGEPLRRTVFRVSHLGAQTAADVDDVLSALRHVLAGASKGDR